jgi:hypothetical protein
MIIWAMSEPLPDCDFQWISANECENIDWRVQEDDQPYGYFVECDLDYPSELHHDHNDYPLAPERMIVTDEKLSTTQAELRSKYHISHNSTSKLVPNLYPKRKYICHYRLLKFYIDHGMVLVKIHRAIRFRQSRWMESYISTNTRLRALSNDPVEINLRKNMNNSVYGKTCENVLKRSDIRLVNDEKKCEKLIHKPHCFAFIFTINL